MYMRMLLARAVENIAWQEYTPIMLGGGGEEPAREEDRRSFDAW